MNMEIEEVGTDHDIALKVDVPDWKRHSLTAFYDKNKIGQFVYQGYRCNSDISVAERLLLIIQTVEKLQMDCEEVLFTKAFGNDENLSPGSRELLEYFSNKSGKE